MKVCTIVFVLTFLVSAVLVSFPAFVGGQASSVSSTPSPSPSPPQPSSPSPLPSSSASDDGPGATGGGVTFPTAVASPPVGDLNLNSSWGGNNSDVSVCERIRSGGNYSHQIMCSAELVEGVIARTYYDYQHCSSGNYTPACMGGFFASNPDQRWSGILANRSLASSSAVPYEVSVCCPGYWCPAGLICMILCSEGAYCPNDAASSNDTSSDGLCKPYNTVAKPYLGCGGAESNFPCPAGYYCPDTVTIHDCPQFHYCPSGSSKPQPCPLMAACPRNSTAPKLDLGGLAKVLMMLGLLLCFVFVGRRNSAKRWEQRIQERDHDKKVGLHEQDKMKQRETDEEEDEELEASRMEEQPLMSSTNRSVLKLDLLLENVGVKLRKNGKNVWLLSKVNGKLSAGRVTAIMGPSGAGKSVLVHTLAGRLSAGTIEGRLVINGRSGYSLREWPELVGFVPQEDIMHRDLTVFENVDFNARWRLPREMSTKRKTDKVFDTLEVLGLSSGRVMRTRIGDDTERGVSGGERKRVNIAMELVTQPSLLLLDEPTSGLDASTCIDVITALKKVATTGSVNVVVVIHQPRVEMLRLFDDLLLLAPGGRTVYAGPTDRALAYFESLGYRLPADCNPADFFLDVICGRVPRVCPDGVAVLAEAGEDHASFLVDRWEVKLLEEEFELLRHSQELMATRDLPSSRRQMASMLSQTLLCFRRAVVQRSRELTVALTDYSLMATVGLVLGLLFHASELQKVPVVNLYLSLAIGFSATQQSLRLFGNERTVFEREAITGISRTAYVIGKNLSTLADLLLLPFIFVSMFISFSNPRGSFRDYFILMAAAQWLLSGLGQAISIVVEPAKAQLASVVLTLILNGMSGFSPSRAELGAFGLLCLGSYSFWLMEALFVIEMKHYPDIYAQAKHDIATMYDYDLDRSMWLNVGVLIAMGLAARVFCLAALLVTNQTPLQWRWLSTFGHFASQLALRLRRRATALYR